MEDGKSLRPSLSMTTTTNFGMGKPSAEDQVAASSSSQAIGSPVTVKERKVKEKGRKVRKPFIHPKSRVDEQLQQVREPTYTLYVSTPEGQLVLARTLSEIVSLDARVSRHPPV